MRADTSHTPWATKRTPRRRRVIIVVALITIATGLSACGESTITTAAAPAAAPADKPIAPLSGAGPWLIDAAGRVVMLHGMNMVQKSDPYYPAAYGFGDDDVAFLTDNG